MRKKVTLKMWVLLAISFFILSCAKEEERRVSAKEIPHAVVSSFNQTYPGAVVKVYSEEKEEGKTFYEISFTWQEKEFDVLFDPEGKIVETEEKISPDSLPPAVKERLSTDFSEYRIDRMERVEKEAKVLFEAKLTGGKDNQKLEVVFNPNGEVVKREVIKKEE